MESLKDSSGWFAVTFSSETLVTSLSPGIKPFEGCSNEEMIGRPVTQFLDDRTVFKMPHILNAAKEEGRWHGEIIYRDCLGKAIKAHGTVMMLSDNESRLSGYLMVSKLTGTRNSGAARGSTHANVGLHLRALVHDLNNPLAIVMGSTQLLALNTACPGKIRSDIEKIYSELEKVVHVVEKLHGYAFSLCEGASNPAEKENNFQNSA